jgi:hypothetical protein
VWTYRFARLRVFKIAGCVDILKKSFLEDLSNAGLHHFQNVSQCVCTGCFIVFHRVVLRFGV